MSEAFDEEKKKIMEEVAAMTPAEKKEASDVLDTSAFGEIFKADQKQTKKSAETDEDRSGYTDEEIASGLVPSN